MKTELTRRFENSIYSHFRKIGYFIAFEVQFGFHQIGDSKQYADAAIYNTQKELTCFEIKVTKSDFHSKAKKTFVGHKNYYAMPYELYEQVKDEIPEEVGVYSFVLYGKFSFFECVKKAKKVECKVDELTILWSMIRSRTNGTSVDIRWRTTITEDLLNTIHQHLYVVDDQGHKINDIDSIHYDDNYFIELYISQEFERKVFDIILNFMRNYTCLNEENKKKELEF